MRKGYLITGIICLIGALIATVKIPYYNSHEIIQVAGIALKMEEDQLIAEFELFEPDFENYLGKSKETVHSSGKNLEECVQNLSKTYGKELFLRDTAVLILAEQDLETLVPMVEEFYLELKNNQLDLPVFLWNRPENGFFFGDKGISLDIKRSAKMLNTNYTLKDLINREGDPAYITGGDGYEISEIR